MAVVLIIEDGSGLANSNAYTDRPFSDVYHENLGRIDWGSANTSDRDAALIRATSYIDQRFGFSFVGEKETKDQALEWPREDAFDRYGFELLDEVPLHLAQATAEYALQALRVGELAPKPPQSSQAEGLTGTQTGVAASGLIARTKDRVGPIEEEIEYSGGGSSSISLGTTGGTGSLPDYPPADMLIRKLLKTGGGVIR